MRRCWPDIAIAALACALLLGAGAAGAAPSREELAVRTSQAAIGRAAGRWPVTDQSGRALDLADLYDKPLVVSFIYTGCFQVCPATTQFLKRAVGEARSALGRGSFRVVSIGFNQPFDGPQALADFARTQGVTDADWLFLAPREQDVEPLLARFGLSVQRTPAGFDHLIQASIVDTRGVIVRQVYGDRFELPMFIDPLKQILGGDAARELSLDNIWTKVKLYCTVYDPASGKYKLDYSLFFELFAGATTLGAVAWYMLRELRRR
jgi:protein SCO1/2